MAWRVLPWWVLAATSMSGPVDGREMNVTCSIREPRQRDWQTVPHQRAGTTRRGDAWRKRVVVHIGLMKSGTTFLQGRLNANREQLAEQGVLFPGPTWRRHVNAVADFMEAHDRQPGSWDSLLEEINDHPGTAVVSMEFLTMLGPPKIAILAESLDTPDLRIVVGVRDLGRTVPAMWQEVVKNRKTWTYAEYVESIRTDGQGGKRFWRQQHSGRVVTRWANTLTPDQVYVVTLPPPGAPSETLWNRFCEVAGIESAHWQRRAAVQRVTGSGVGAGRPRAQPAHPGPDASRTTSAASRPSPST